MNNNILLKNFLEKMQLDKNEITILEIGGNDGYQNDLIYPYAIKTNFVTHILEPIPVYYEQLKILYENYKNVHTYNYAITKKTEVDYINYIPPADNMPVWLKGCSSFFSDKNVINGMQTRNLDDSIAPFVNETVMKYIKNNIQKLPVNCLSFKDFIELSKISNIDILVVDTEGYELEILKQIDLNKFSISLIILEYHNHYCIDKLSMESLLRKFNYSIAFTDHNFDIIGYKY